MAIIIGSIKQETNSFCAVPTTLEDFEKGYLYYGDEIMEHLAGSRTGEGGFIDILKKAGKTVEPTIAAMPASSSGGVVKKEAYHYLQDKLLEYVERINDKGELEGILLNMHGSMIAEDCDDVEGVTVERVRKIVGREIPIAVSLDGHAYISQALLNNADIIVGYSTFPHVDEYETGYKAADILLRILNKEIKPVMKAVHIPMLLSPEAELDSVGPLSEILGLCRESEQDDRILSVTFFPVQPWMDIPGLASTALAIADDNAELAKKKAEKIARKAWALRFAFESEHVTPNEAVRYAIAASKGPTIISEVGDAPPAGAPGDSNCLLKALLEERIEEPAYVTVIDPEAVEAAYAAGVGNVVKTSVGYKLDPRWGDPIKVEGLVTKLTIGQFTSQQIGTIVNMGKTAILEISSISLVLCERSFNHLDPNSYISLGLDPLKAKIVGVKSTQHFRAFYGPIAADIYLLDMKGPSSSNFKGFEWRRLSRPMWPLDDFDWKV